MDFPDAVILTAVLDTLASGVIVVDDERKPLFANARAAAMIGEGCAFQVDSLGSLRAANTADDKALRDSIVTAQRGQSGAKYRPIPIHSDNTKPAIFAWVSVLPLEYKTARAAEHGKRQIGERRNVTSLMITEKTSRGAGKDVLADLFGLTLAESRLLQRLLQGMSPNQYAAQQGLSQNTVRNQLKSIFEKADVRRQSDLISLVSNLLPPVNFERAIDCKT